MNDTSTPVRTHNQFPLDRIVRHGSVLRTLLAASGRSMTVRELAGRAGTPYATTWRLVQDLLAAGVLLGQRIGPSLSVTVNDRSPFLGDLRTILAMELSPHRRAARRFAELASRVPVVRRVILFGSVARRRETVGSDVDVAVILDRGTKSSWSDVLRCAADVLDETGLAVVPIRMTAREMARRDRFPRMLAEQGEVLYARP
jgi:predicted nucleotidyltransferase